MPGSWARPDARSEICGCEGRRSRAAAKNLLRIKTPLLADRLSQGGESQGRVGDFKRRNPIDDGANLTSEIVVSYYAREDSNPRPCGLEV